MKFLNNFLQLVIICNNLNCDAVFEYFKRLKNSGTFCIWLEGASGLNKIKQMNFKHKDSPEPIQTPEIYKN